MSENINNIEKILNIYDRVKKEIIRFLDFIKIKSCKVNLKKLIDKEKIIVNKFYNTNLKEFTLSSITLLETDETYPIILKLIKRNILKNMTDLEKIGSYNGNGVKY